MTETLNSLPRTPTTRWVRSTRGIIAGVCEGIARRLGVETWIVRFLLVMAILFCGTGLLAYVILAICLPREDRVTQAYQPMILGVCSRISRRTDVEVGVVRTATVLLAFVTLGAVIVGYVVLYFVMPDPALQTERT